MLEITVGANDEIILAGRFDASQVEKARQFFFGLPAGRVVDLASLDYISSAGLGILLATQKRLNDQGEALRLINPRAHIRDVFHFSGFDQLFRMD
jgi:anti-sigma B factor antagonist